MTEEMKTVMDILKSENSYVKSQISGVPDLLWSMGMRTVTINAESLIKWFYTSIPAFDDRVPMDILKEDGETELFQKMQSIPC